MRRPVLASVILVAAGGCTCGSKSAPRTETADAAPSASAGEQAVAATGAVRFSRPIAAVRAGSGAVIVAGLVAAEKAIVVTGIDARGGSTFTTRAFRNVGWTADAELRTYPAEGGAAVVWHGMRGGKMVRQMSLIGKDGALKAEAVDVGPATCATDDGVAWTAPAGGGKTNVLVRPWGAAGAHVVSTVAADREPIVVCAAHRVFALGQGDDDVVFALGDGGAARTLVGTDDFGLDEERELEELTVGDDLAVFRVGSTGALALRETKAGALSPWRRLTATIPADDDVVAVDGDGSALLAVTTRDEPDACRDAGGTGTGSSVHGLRFAREGGESTALLAPAECGRDFGPFWIGATGAGLVVAWAERVPKEGPAAAPIAGLVYRAYAGKVPAASGRLAVPADALVDAGCDDAKCYAVALARAPGTTEMEPEALKVLVYP